MNLQKTLCIDPGIEFGFALFVRLSQIPVDTGVYIPDKKLNWQDRAVGCFDWLCRYLSENSVDRVVIEYPQFFDSTKGRMVANDGSLVKLVFVVGGLSAVAFSRGASVKLVEVNRWKGQLSKKTVQKRVIECLGAKACMGFDSHVWDAVGLGLWHRGLINQ